jgi:hypothetical protein
MAIEPVMADVIQKLRSELPNDRVLCLGYPDILNTGERPTDPERIAIARWHHWKGGIEDAGHFFGRQELNAEYWDVTKARGPERIVDLNQPQPVRNVFGLVIDPGTIEHIACISQCWHTIISALQVNGLVIHSNPMTMANHGFYSIHPTAYVDIYEANGFKILMLLELSGPLDKRVIREVPKTGRYEAAPNAVMLCVARKVKEVAFTWPTQTKYRKNPTLKISQEKWREVDYAL